MARITTTIPARDADAAVLYSVYEPFMAPSGEEIPGYTIYRDGEPVAFTDQSLSREEQEHAAQVFLAAHLLLASLEKIMVEGALDHVHPGVRDEFP